MGHSEAAESVERAFALRIFPALQCATQEERALGSSPQLLYLDWKSQLLLDPMSESTPTPHPTPPRWAAQGFLCCSGLRIAPSKALFPDAPENRLLGQRSLELFLLLVMM